MSFSWIHAWLQVKVPLGYKYFISNGDFKQITFRWRPLLVLEKMKSPVFQRGEKPLLLSTVRLLQCLRENLNGILLRVGYPGLELSILTTIICSMFACRPMDSSIVLHDHDVLMVKHGITFYRPRFYSAVWSTNEAEYANISPVA